MEGIGDAIGSYFSGTAPVGWADLVFPVKVIGVSVTGPGGAMYSFIEQVPNPQTGRLVDAYPGRSGDANWPQPAFDMGGGSVLSPPFYAWARPRGIFGGALCYDIIAPLGTSGDFYNSYVNYIGGQVTYGAGETVYYTTTSIIVYDGPTVNVIDNTTYNIYPGASFNFVTVDETGTVISTALSIISGVGGALTYDFLLDGYPVSTLPPVSGQVLTFDGVEWTPVTPGGPSAAIPQWIKVTKTHTDLNAAATTNDIEIYAAARGTYFDAIVMKTTTAFGGGGIAVYNLSIGYTGFTSAWINSYDGTAAVSDANSAIGYVNGFANSSFAVNSIRLAASCTGANLNAATAGAVDIWLRVSVLP